MKANGKNLIMFSYQIQGTMDWKPETCFRTTESREKMQEFIDFMQGHTGDNIFNVKEVSPFEYFQARQSKYWRGYEADLDKAAEDCSKQWIEEYDFYVRHKDYDESALNKAYYESVKNTIEDTFNQLLLEDMLIEETLEYNEMRDKVIQDEINQEDDEIERYIDLWEDYQYQKKYSCNL